MTRRRIARAYRVGPYRVVRYALTPGLWSIIEDNGRPVTLRRYVSLGAALAAAQHLPP